MGREHEGAAVARPVMMDDCCVGGGHRCGSGVAACDSSSRRRESEAAGPASRRAPHEGLAGRNDKGVVAAASQTRRAGAGRGQRCHRLPAARAWHPVGALAFLMLLHLHGVLGQRYVEIDEFVAFRDDTQDIERQTIGTPPNNHIFELPCSVRDGSPNCAIAGEKMWGRDRRCPSGSICFLVTTHDADEVVFTTSPVLAEHLDSRAVKATIEYPKLMDDATHKIVQYVLSDVHGFPEFTKPDDLEVCFDTVPAGAGKRCVQFYFGVPPFNLRLSVDGGPFTPLAMASMMPYQRSRVVVRVTDVNRMDRVCIDHPYTLPTEVSGVPNRVEDDSAQAFFEWEDVGRCYDSTRCVSGLVDGVLCEGGEWERIFTIKAKVYNATLRYSDTSDVTTTGVKSSRRIAHSSGQYFSDRCPEHAELKLNVLRHRPAFIDDVPGANRVRGTPYSLQRLETAFVNCPLRKVAVYALLQLWSNETLATGQVLYSFKSSEDVEIIAHGDMPGGSVVTRPAAISLQRTLQKYSGNYFLEGRISSVEIDWTPGRGDEGRDHWMCFTARGKSSLASNTRCFVVPVARCQYCALEGDSLHSLAVDFKTSWLQLWSANSGPGTFPIEASGLVWMNVGASEPTTGRNLAHVQLAEALQVKTEFSQQEWDEFQIRGLHTDHYIKSGDSYFRPAYEDDAYPLNPARLPPKTRLSLGPIYHVKPHDTMDSLAVRFHTHVDRLMEMNPDLETPDIETGQELCIIPDVCPEDK